MVPAMEIKPIGVFHSSQKFPYEAGRQPDSFHSDGYIVLNSRENFEQAIEDLELFSHIWILFQFHHNQNWKPKVLPPRGQPQKRGVFATRSPYRPNPIGMSAVRLIKIEGLKIWVAGADILDGSPVLDIKPYIPYADSILEANNGWIESQEFSISFSAKAQEQLSWLKSQNLENLESFIIHQLSFEPTDSQRKRVHPQQDGSFTLAYRTWRIHFLVLDTKISITLLSSGYSPEDLLDPNDPYGDKKLHKSFNETFN